jgi:rod shape-determining protein MreC
VTRGIEGWDGYVALRGANDRARELARRVALLELDRLEKERLRAENDRLRALLGFAETEPDLETVGARVVGVRLDPKGLQLVTIDRGEDAGLARMMPVIVAQGVVGRVHSVNPGTADVLLVSDRNSSVATLVERSRARANVRGTGDPYTCRLDYALRSDDLIEDDVLVTSGTDGVFPRGLPVGRVKNLKKQGQGLYQKADLAPAVDLTKVEEVLVVTGGGLREREPPAPPPVAEPAPVAVPKRTPGPDTPPVPVSGAAAKTAQARPERRP